MLEAIRQEVAERRRGPTVRELADRCGFRSTSAVAYQLAALERAGLIRRRPGKARGLALLGLPAPAALLREVVPVPLVGQIAAGAPIAVPDDLAAGEFAEMVEVGDARRRDGLFALTVRGHSMVDALIDDGDIVILRHAETAEDDQTVAVWLEAERETTLKVFYREGDRVRLQPASVRIQGMLVGVLRRLA